VWKKNEPEPTPQQPIMNKPTAPRSEPRGSRATIGSSIDIKGDLSGEEDLLVEGRVEGKIILKKNTITIGKNGRVKADVHGSSIHVDGRVRGNLYGEKEIIIRASGNVEGNLVAPRVTLENGSQFKGSIDMEPRKETPRPGGALAGAPAAADKQDIKKEDHSARPAQAGQAQKGSQNESRRP
jgi:cytoskeletal protein CcmA (bactofilin family)